MDERETHASSHALVPGGGLGMPAMEAGVLLHNIQRIIQVGVRAYACVFVVQECFALVCVQERWSFGGLVALR